MDPKELESKPYPSENDEPRIGWGEGCYRVIELKQVGEIVHDLPGQSGTLLSNFVLEKKPDVLIFSEPRGGVRDLLSWWCERLKKAQQPWVQIPGDTWEQDIWKWSDVANTEKYDLNLISVDTLDDLIDEGRSLLIVALIGIDLHIRVFDANGKKIFDKTEKDLLDWEPLTELKKRLSDSFNNKLDLSKQDKQAIIEDVVLHVERLERQRTGQAIEKFGTKEKGIQARIDALRSWADTLTQLFTLVIIDIMDIGEDIAFEMARAIRLIRDRGVCPNLRFVIVSQTESLFVDTARASGLSAVCKAYRPPLFTQEEIQTLMASNKFKEWHPLNLADTALDYFMEHTGGHPLLVQYLMQRLQKIIAEMPTSTKEPRQVTPEEIDEAARRLRNAPPETTREWQDHLKTLLRDNTTLVEKMKTYVKGVSLGESHFPPPHDERGLFLSGWLSHSPLSKRWGITSEFHAHLAREVLDALQEEKDMQ